MISIWGQSRGFNFASLWAGGKKGMWYQPLDANTRYQDQAGTMPATIANPATGLLLDKSGNALPLRQATSTARPLFDSPPDSLKYNGVDAGMSTDAFSAGTLGDNMDCFIAIKRNSTGRFMALTPGNDTATYLGVASSGGSYPPSQNAGSPTCFVNGVTLAPNTADALNSALTLSWNILEFRGANLSSWTSMGISSAEGWQFNGSIGSSILCQAQSDAVRTQIRQALAAEVGVVLP